MTNSLPTTNHREIVPAPRAARAAQKTNLDEALSVLDTPALCPL
jgi:hypothetical protein